MNKVLGIIDMIVANAPKVKYYANLIIHVVDMLDGVQDWKKNNKPNGEKLTVNKK